MGPLGIRSGSSTSRPRDTMRSPKTRSLSDGGTPGKLSPSPLIVEATRKTSKDDNHIRDYTPAPSTPNRSSFAPRGLSIHMLPQREPTSPAQSPAAAFTKPAPLSPKLDHSQIYASPTNILPRRSRGLDFSRAATSLHHSTLAEQSSPDSSPTISGGRAMNIPAHRGHRTNEYGLAEQSSNSLWSVMGNQERMHISSSVGSTHPMASDSSSSDDDDLMDEDTDEAYVTTPQTTRSAVPSGIQGGPGSPAVNSLLSFQQRQRPRKQNRKKLRGPLGLGFSSAATMGALSKSPPSKDSPMSHSRRESISWQANQLHISGSEEERAGDSIHSVMGTPTSNRHTIMRQVATRRGNLMVGLNPCLSDSYELIIYSQKRRISLGSSMRCLRKVLLWRPRFDVKQRSFAKSARATSIWSHAYPPRSPRRTSPTRTS